MAKRNLSHYDFLVGYCLLKNYLNDTILSLFTTTLSCVICNLLSQNPLCELRNTQSESGKAYNMMKRYLKAISSLRLSQEVLIEL